MEIDEEMAALGRLRDDPHHDRGVLAAPRDDGGCAADLTPIPSNARCDETDQRGEKPMTYDECTCGCRTEPAETSEDGACGWAKQAPRDDRAASR